MAFDTLAEARDAFLRMSSDAPFNSPTKKHFDAISKAMGEAEKRMLALELVVSALANKAGLTDADVPGQRTTRVFADGHVKQLLAKQQ